MILHRRSRWGRAGVVALALITASAPAAARDALMAGPAVVPARDDVVVVLPISGDLDDHIARALEERVAASLRRGGLEVVPAAAVRAGPTVGLRQLGSANGARYLVRIEVAVAGRDYNLRLVLLRADSGEPTITSDELCEICGHEELAERVGDMASTLGRKLGSAVDPQPRLRVLTRPDGSGVSIDGAAVGVTPLDIPVAAGEHEVLVERPGFVAHRRRLTFADGITRTIASELGPVAKAEPEQPRRARRLAPFGWGSLGLGLGATGGGLALVALHQRPILSDCAGANIDAMGRCKWRHDTLTGGVALSLVGVAVITIGVVLLVIDRRRSRRSQARASMLVHPSGLGFRF